MKWTSNSKRNEALVKHAPSVPHFMSDRWTLVSIQRPSAAANRKSRFQRMSRLTDLKIVSFYTAVFAIILKFQPNMYICYMDYTQMNFWVNTLYFRYLHNVIVEIASSAQQWLNRWPRPPWMVRGSSNPNSKFRYFCLLVFAAVLCALSASSFIDIAHFIYTATQCASVMFYLHPAIISTVERKACCPY